jgi:hypothetical protein
MTQGDTDSLLRAAFNSTAIDERRKFERRACGLMITVFGCDENGIPDGRMAVGHCIDVSDGGIRIALAKPLDSKLLRIEPLQSAPVFGFRSAVVFVLRSRTEQGCTIYAGLFIYTDSD